MYTGEVFTWQRMEYHVATIPSGATEIALTKDTYFESVPIHVHVKMNGYALYIAKTFDLSSIEQ